MIVAFVGANFKQRGICQDLVEVQDQAPGTAAMQRRNPNLFRQPFGNGSETGGGLRQCSRGPVGPLPAPSKGDRLRLPDAQKIARQFRRECRAGNIHRRHQPGSRDSIESVFVDGPVAQRVAFLPHSHSSCRQTGNADRRAL